MQSTYDVIVVGGGASGLTASAYTSRTGASTLLLEQQKELGGLVQSVTRNGFTFDMGLRAIDNSGIVLPMLEELGLELDYVKSPVSVGIEADVIDITSKDSLVDYQKLLERYFPEETQDIAEIIQVIRTIMKKMDVLYGIDNPLFKDLKRDYPYIFKTLLPWLVTFLVTIGSINRMQQPVEELLATLTDNQSLQDIIGQHFFKKTPAFFAMSYIRVYLDYIYPIGGTASVLEKLRVFSEDKGLRVITGSRVVAVDPGKRVVYDAEGGEYYYKELIWCADLNQLYTAALPHVSFPGALTHRIRERKEELSSLSGGDSVFSLFLSVDEKPEYFSEIAAGHFFYSPKRRGLGALRKQSPAEMLRVLTGAGEPGGRATRSEAKVDAQSRGPVPLPQELKSYISDFLTYNTFEISIPVLKDRALAPSGQTGLIISCLSDYDLFAEAERLGCYEELKEFFAESIMAIFSDSIYPGLSGKVLDYFCATPVTLQKTTGNTQGAITGWAFTSDQPPVPHRIQDIGKSVETLIPHVHKAGQWSYSPSGFPIAVLTGKLAAVSALKRLRK